MEIDGIEIEVLRRAVLRLSIAVYPPDGKVRLTVPLWIGEELIRGAVRERRAWIDKQRKRIAGLPRRIESSMESGETQWFRGRPYSLELREASGRERVALREPSTIELTVKPGSEASHRRDLLDRWRRKELQSEIDALIADWEPILGVKAGAAGIRRMKTRWGSCNTRTRRLTFNLELARKPRECVEYVVVHELVHLLERSHGPRFKALMDQALPGWRSIRKALNAAP
jgi:predicted metal-dependent hydrolase